MTLRTALIHTLFAVCITLVGCKKAGSSDSKDEAFTKAVNAVFDNDLETLKSLLDADSELVTERDTWDASTLLHAAVTRNSRKDVVSWLLSKGSEVNATNDVGQTPLHFAYRFNASESAVELLINAGADPDSKDLYGKVPIDYD